MSDIRSMFGDLPMRGIWFAPYGTPCPRNAWEPLGPEWSTDLPRERDDDVRGFGDPYRIEAPDRFARMSVVFDAGTATERARLLLPQVQVVQDYSGPEPGVVAKWMVTAPRLRRFMREREQMQVNRDEVKPFGRPVGVGGGGGGAATVNAAAREQALAAVRRAATQARECGIGVGEIMDEYSQAVTEYGRVERRRKVTATFREFLRSELGEVLRPEVLDDVAAGAADRAQILADEGTFGVREQ